MKKIGSVVLLSLLVVALSFTFVCAGELELLSSNPVDGYDKVEPKNVMIKLFFNESVIGEAAQAVNGKATEAANAGIFTLKDAEGNSVPMKVYYDEKDNTKISLLLGKDLTPNMAYTFSFSGVMADSGNVMSAEKTINFSTRKADTGGTYMVMMLVMVGAMIVITMRDTRRKMTAEQESTEKTAEKINPYKLAKEENISVAEAVKRIEEMKEKEAKKAEKAEKARGQKAKPDVEKKDPAAPVKKVYSVKTKKAVKKNDNLK